MPFFPLPKEITSKKIEKLFQEKVAEKRKKEEPLFKIFDSTPRDGIQNLPMTLPAEVRIYCINLLSEILRKGDAIETGAFVRLPSMANSDTVFNGINKKDGIDYVLLLPNEKGLEIAIKNKVGIISIVSAASDVFLNSNQKSTVKETMTQYVQLTQIAKKQNIKIRGYVSVVMGYYDEALDKKIDISVEEAADVVEGLLDMGCYEISLGDTIGNGTPKKMYALLHELVVERKIDPKKLAGHLHGTEDALEMLKVFALFGIERIDTVIGENFGGCPHAGIHAPNMSLKKVINWSVKNGSPLDNFYDIEKIEKAEEYLNGEIERSKAISLSLEIFQGIAQKNGAR